MPVLWVLKGELGQESHAYAQSHRSEASSNIDLIEDLPTGPSARVEHDIHRHSPANCR